MTIPIVPRATSQARFVQTTITGDFNRNSPSVARHAKREKALFRRIAPIT
ncbi:MAG: hypothetical protein GX795_10495 [Firmicutes bacterium]|nr:hypothetical protein [Bacillota bacterium]